MSGKPQLEPETPETASDETDVRQDASPDGDRQSRYRRIWRQKGRRYVTGLNVFTSIVLAALLLLMINFLAYKYGYLRWDEFIWGLITRKVVS